MKTGIAWWSGGVTSAVAIKVALDSFNYGDVQIYFCETNQHHPDNERFKKDCERWYGQKIHVLQNKKWNSVEKVLEHGYINSPGGAFCTKVLKKDVRIALEKIVPFDFQIFGFEFDDKQIKRANRFIEQYPSSLAKFPLIDREINKLEAMKVLAKAGIELPAMYRLGFNNANCMGCVKGGKGYWNLTRKVFPAIFDRTAKLERAAGHSCLNGTFLDELDPQAGRHESIELPECGIYCEVEALGG